MKLIWSAAVLIAIFVAGCDGTSVTDDPPITPGEVAPVESPGEPPLGQPRLLDTPPVQQTEEDTTTTPTLEENAPNTEN